MGDSLSVFEQLLVDFLIFLIVETSEKRVLVGIACSLDQL